MRRESEDLREVEADRHGGSESTSMGRRRERNLGDGTQKYGGKREERWERMNSARGTCGDGDQR